MSFFLDWRNSHKALLGQIAAYAETEHVKLHIVGGILRDLITRRTRTNPDIDFCLPRNALVFSRKLARHLKAGFVVLDEEHGTGRIVLKRRDSCYTLDFSDFRGPAIEEDLRGRDFTINAMAVPLEGFLSAKGLERIIIDPFQGRKDIRKKNVRMVCADAFREDPLRVLRAYSAAAQFGMRIDRVTRAAVRRQYKMLKTVSAERIRDEVFKIMSSPRSAHVCKMLEDDGVLEFLFPEVTAMRRFRQRPGNSRLDIWNHSLESLKQIERICQKRRKDVSLADYLNAELSAGRSRLALLKFACLFHDIGKPRTFKRIKKKVTFYGHERAGASMISDIAARLKLSNEENRMLRRTVFLHLRPGYLVTVAKMTPRARFRFFRDAAGDAVGVLLLAIADERATRDYLVLEAVRKRYERVVPGMIKYYFRSQSKPAPRLINGHDIMARFSLPPSALIGSVLREVEELQALGKLATKEEALDAAAEMIKESAQSLARAS